MDRCDDDDPSIVFTSHPANGLFPGYAKVVPLQGIDTLYAWVVRAAAAGPLVTPVACSDQTAAAIARVADSDLTVPAGSGNGGGSTVYRVREGIERFMITDINNPAASALSQSEIGVMYDIASGNQVARFNHVPGGANVLYMDGHVEFLKYPGKAPVSVNGANLEFIVR
jgi:prepilin-type processing-associated H-X9-DG protein